MKRTLMAVCVAAASQAMADVPPEAQIEHVLVTVPIHKRAAETALPVTVLTGDELRRLATSTLGETLGDKPGISNSSFGPGVGRQRAEGPGPTASTAATAPVSSRRSATRVAIPVHWAPDSGGTRAARSMRRKGPKCSSSGRAGLRARPCTLASRAG